MLEDGSLQLLILMVPVACALAAVHWSKQLLLRQPEVQPYKWGYFTASTSIAVGVAFVIAHFAGAAITEYWWMAAIVGIAIGILIFKRQKLGWVLWYSSQLAGIVMDGLTPQYMLTIVIMVLTLIYLKKRWHEFALYPGHSPVILDSAD